VYAEQRLDQSAYAAPQWSLGRRIAFRFFAPYLVLYHLDWLAAVFGNTVPIVRSTTDTSRRSATATRTGAAVERGPRWAEPEFAVRFM